MHGDIKNSLRRELHDREYAESYAESFLNSFVATQIKVIREQRKMTQGELAQQIGTTQAGISRIENVNYTSWSIRTLAKLAKAFDVRLKVSFEPYGTLPDEVISFDRNALERVAREKDPGLSDQSFQTSIPVREIGNKNLIDIGIWKNNEQPANRLPLGGMDNQSSAASGAALCG